MIIDPGIFDQAHKLGIKYITDVNGDGAINGEDINLALEKKAAYASQSSEAGAQNR